jgi:nucleotide-binding universal stress UspA family protein
MSSNESLEFEQAVTRAAASLPNREQRNGYTQILLAYDGSADARAALERAVAVAADDAEVTVVTVIPYEAVGSQIDPIKHSDRQWQWRCLVDATAYLRGYGIDPYIEATAGNPAPVICETARSLHADLVILGNGHGGRWRPSIRRNPIRAYVQKHVDCDTLVARPAIAKPAPRTSAEQPLERTDRSREPTPDRGGTRPRLTRRPATP